MAFSGFRFCFEVGEASDHFTEAASDTICHVPDKDPDTTSTEYCYIAAPSPMVSTPGALPIAGSDLVKAHVDADRVAPGGRDVIRGVYEGGAKVWECTLDVEHWIRGAGNGAISAAKVVIDLGCGAGILGCAVMQVNAASNLVFQDLNVEVLRQLTVPTIQLNCGSKALSRTVLLASDWRNLCKDVSSVGSDTAWLKDSCDVIVSSETLYAESAYPALIELLRLCLTPTGIAVIGSKAFYFGVGGAASTFIEAANAGGLCAKVVSTIDDTRTVVRVLVSVCKPS
jgi:hypothetical protein